MLEKPDLRDDLIATLLWDEYRLRVAQLDFLPLGADLNTAVYRVLANDATVYFLKLRRGAFNEASVSIPKYLSEIGIRQIISSFKTRSGQLWAHMPPFRAILYPFVQGQHGFARKLSDAQWAEFGAALKRVHTAAVPARLTSSLQYEMFSPEWRNKTRLFLERFQQEAFREPVAFEVASFLKIKADETLELVTHTERLAQILLERPPEFIMCHADIHAWNLLIDDNGAFYMVDWDSLIFAPKEHDLMFIGGGLAGNGHPPHEEEALFYRGYGQAAIDPIAMAYYRYERIVEDIAAYCEQILLSDEGGEDRKQSLEYLKSNFLPGGVLDLARKADRTASQASEN